MLLFPSMINFIVNFRIGNLLNTFDQTRSKHDPPSLRIYVRNGSVGAGSVSFFYKMKYNIKCKSYYNDNCLR